MSVAAMSSAAWNVAARFERPAKARLFALSLDDAGLRRLGLAALPLRVSPERLLQRQFERLVAGRAVPGATALAPGLWRFALRSDAVGEATILAAARAQGLDVDAYLRLGLSGVFDAAYDEPARPAPPSAVAIQVFARHHRIGDVAAQCWFAMAAMAEAANGRGQVRLTRDELARRLDCDMRYAGRQLEHLRRAGLIRRCNSGGWVLTPERGHAV